MLKNFGKIIFKPFIATIFAFILITSITQYALSQSTIPQSYSFSYLNNYPYHFYDYYPSGLIIPQFYSLNYLNYYHYPYNDYYPYRVPTPLSNFSSYLNNYPYHFYNYYPSELTIPQFYSLNYLNYYLYPYGDYFPYWVPTPLSNLYWVPTPLSNLSSYLNLNHFLSWYIYALGTAIPSPKSIKNRIRVMTYNTHCIVPMQDEGVMNKIFSALEKLEGFCLGDIAAIIADPVAYGLTELVDELGDFTETVEDRVNDRANKIVQNILDHPDVDIIVFNEVFSEDARKIFIKGLSQKFPNYIAKIGKETDCQEDSGLMLFSRAEFSFMDLPDALRNRKAEHVEAHRQWAPYLQFNEVAFVQFEDCDCEDCLASKGAAYVRIKNDYASYGGHRILHVVFTHLQADPDFCYGIIAKGVDPHGSRAKQMEVIEQIVKDATGGNDPAHDVYLVMGDLNIHGLQEEARKAWNEAVQPNPQINPDDLYEWNTHFGPDTASFFSEQDTWAYTTSPSDPGLSSGGTRYDYLLMGGNDYGWQRRMVPQHLTLRFPPDLSDHRGVHAVINLYEPHCIPKEAIVFQKGATAETWQNPNRPYEGQIQLQGGMQWFRFDVPGTYSFSVWDLRDPPASAVDLHVYEHFDLSSDVIQYYDEVTDLTEFFLPDPLMGIPPIPKEVMVGKKFGIPQAPFYVRVAAVSSSWYGNFWLYYHRHEGRSKNDAISLPANSTTKYLAGKVPINSEDMPWFHLRTEEPLGSVHGSISQSLRFITMWDPAKGGGPFNLNLLDDSNNTIASENAVSWTNPNDESNNSPAYGESCTVAYTEIHRDDLDAQGDSWYLRVKRPDPIAQYDEYFLRWETNLSIIHGILKEEHGKKEGHGNMMVHAEDETCLDWTGSDEISLGMTPNWPNGYSNIYIAYSPDKLGSTDIDSGDIIWLNFIGSIRIIKPLGVTIYEVDGTSSDTGTIVVNILPPDVEKLWKQTKEVYINCSGIGNDGIYQFKYNLSRNLKTGTCKNDRICK